MKGITFLEGTRVTSMVSADGSMKYRFAVDDQLAYEAAFFSVADRHRPNIACVSTQLGCAVGCIFCAAAKPGFFRNLSPEEIQFQIKTILRDHDAAQLLREGFEVSFMGMGEPLANLDSIAVTAEWLQAMFSEITRISISTAGPSKRIDGLTARAPLAIPVHLQVSLHATDDETRNRLVPNVRDSITNLIAASKRFHIATGDQVCLNYVLLADVNDSPDDAEWLSRLDAEAFYVKISELNPVPNAEPLQAASRDRLQSFAAAITERGVFAKVFVGDGLDTAASCGQLAALQRPLPSPVLLVDR